MCPRNDFGDGLVEEVLTDVAQTFFGSRRELDDMIGILNDYAGRLRNFGAAIEARAGLINHLLIRQETAREFYRRIGVENPSIYLGGRLSNLSLPDRIPFALTRRSRFTQWLCLAYARLHQGVALYSRGGGEEAYGDAVSPEPGVDYRLLEKMCELINRKIRSVNEGISPASVLQYAKGFDTESEARARITGATSGEYAHIDEKFRCPRIEFNMLDLKEFTPLPPPEKVRGRIERFSKDCFRIAGSEIGPRVDRLRADLRSSSRGTRRGRDQR